MLNVVDEFTWNHPGIRVVRKPGSADVTNVLVDLVTARGALTHIRSDCQPEFAAARLETGSTAWTPESASIEAGSPQGSGHVESFNGKFYDELLSCETSNTLAKAKVLHDTILRAHAPRRLASASTGRGRADASHTFRGTVSQARCSAYAVAPLVPASGRSTGQIRSISVMVIHDMDILYSIADMDRSTLSAHVVNMFVPAELMTLKRPPVRRLKRSLLDMEDSYSDVMAGETSFTPAEALPIVVLLSERSL